MGMRRYGSTAARLTLLVIFGAAIGAISLRFIDMTHALDLRASPLAYDWEILWDATRGGHVQWDAGMFSPPWAIIFILPLSHLSLNTSWAIMTLLGATAVAVSVPRYREWQWQLIGILLVGSSYSYRRYFIDTNYEAIAILAVLAVLVAYRQRWPVLFALAGLICTIKPQITFLLVLVVAFYSYQAAPRRFFAQVSMIVGAVVLLSTLWAGKPWLDTLATRPFDYGISLAVTGSKLGAPALALHAAQVLIVGVTLAVAYLGNRKLSRAKAGMLIAASLLSAPFSNLHSALVLLAIAVVPLALERPRIGIWLVLLFNVNYVDYFHLTDNFFDMHAGYGQVLWTSILAASWITLTALVYVTERQSAAYPARLRQLSKQPTQEPRDKRRRIEHTPA
ncbi:hypothetical protein [Aggregatilinea lenta]|uniref:hypothetical protein n=1 Tax=Aggregatilinea lenta TaxID=913108 RepID=UPI000E5A2E7E|nr:hypothetical protein [Aggregatilinea lenta]